MNSKQIAIKYLAPKIEDPKEIFLNEEVFELILPFARDSCRELFATEPSKIVLVNYVDDVGLIVDKYLICRLNKMYQNALKKRNKLFWCLASSAKTISWLIDRWINTFLNLLNKKYLNYIDITKIKIGFNQDMGHYDSDIDEILEFEKLQKLPKEQIMKALKFIYEDVFYDNSFDKEEDIQYLCEKLELDINEIITLKTINLPKFKKVQINEVYVQLTLEF